MEVPLVLSGSGTEAIISATNSSTNYGVYGLYGIASSTGAVVNYGGYFMAHGDSGMGVYGEAPNEGGAYNYGGVFKASGTSGAGVYGSASGSSAKGVWGVAPSTDDVTNYGGYFEAKGDSGRGVYALTSGSHGRGVYGEASGEYGIGVYGNGHQYDFYAGGPGTNYAPFTGAHEVRFSEDVPPEIVPGMIVSVTGRTEVRKTEDGDTSLSSTLPTVTLSKKAMDKAVFGVLVKESPLPRGHWYKARNDARFGVVNALGEGRVWVCNVNGEIGVGDYITTSPVPGYGEIQDDDLLHSYTLGKATETVDWDSVTQTVEYQGREVKVYLIAVVYTSG